LLAQLPGHHPDCSKKAGNVAGKPLTEPGGGFLGRYQHSTATDADG